MTRQTLSRWALLIGALALMFALQGCGGDDNGGLSAADMARIDAAEAAAAAAQAEAMTAHEEAEAATAEADAAKMAADAAKAEADAAKMAAEEAMMDMDEAMPAESVTLEDLYEELAGEKIKEDLRMRVGTEGPLSTTVLKKAILETAKYYHVDGTSAIAYIDENYPTFEVLQRAAVETILEVLHTGNDHLSATAMTAEMVLKGEKGDTGDAGTPAADDDTIADLQAKIEELQTKAAIAPPMPEGAKVIQTGDLSEMAADYDFSMIMDPDKNTGASAKKGTYTGNADVGFAGLNSLQAGGDGAAVFGSWLKYSHWGYIEGEDDSMATFSLGMPTGANPKPQDDDKTTAKWTGLMTGAWMAHEMQPTADGATEPVAVAMADREYETVRGDATITVNFSSSGPAATATADLSIKNLVQSDGTMLGNFQPGEAATPATSAALTAGHQGYTEVWMGMKVGTGDFSRKAITMTKPADDATAAVALAANAVDRPTSMNYLAGRFYGMDGNEVGGVFMENGQISGHTGTVADGFGTDTNVGTEATDTHTKFDLNGILVGAFGADRVTPIQP